MKYSMLSSLAVAATIAIASNPAHAQKKYDIAADRKEAERTMQVLADCIVSRRDTAAKVPSFLRKLPGTPEFGAEGKALALSGCAPKSVTGYQMKFQPLLLRSALYDSLYRREFGKAAVDITDAAPIDFAGELDFGGQAAPDEYTYLRAMGDCTARRDPANIRALVLSRSGSDTEKAALTAAMPAVQNCVAKGNSLHFSRTMLRGALAEALYKLSKAPAVTATKGAN